MDCLTARQILQLACPALELECPAASEPAAADCARAAEHVQACGACQSAIAQQDRFDRRAGQMCRDVAVPLGLKHRLYAALESAEWQATTVQRALTGATGVLVASGNRAAQTTAPSAASGKTRRRIAMAAAACLLLAWGTWQLLAPRPPRLELAAIEQAAALEPIDSALLPNLARFANGTAVCLPNSVNLSRCTITAAAKECWLAGGQVAVYQFTLKKRAGSRSKPLPGQILAIPRVAVASPPVAQVFLQGRVEYIGHFAATAWSEGELVFVCFLSGGEDELQRLAVRRDAS